jgi:hypothetical protein
MWSKGIVLRSKLKSFAEGTSVAPYHVVSCDKAKGDIRKEEESAI